MVERITKSALEGMLKRLNRNLNTDKYQLDRSYGGYRLEVQSGEHGGVSDISFRHTTREMYDVLYAINQVLEREGNNLDKKDRNKTKFDEIHSKGFKVKWDEESEEWVQGKPL